MWGLNSMAGFRQYLRRGRQSLRFERLRSRPGLEQFEDRVVLSTLSVDALGNADYLASPGVANNLTVSERIVPIVPPLAGGTTLPFHFLLEDVITDTSEKITVIGTGASRFAGSGTNQVTTVLPIRSLFVDVLDGNDVVNIQAINYATTVRHIGPGVDTINVGQAGGLSGIQGTLGVEEAGAGSSTHLNIDDSADPTSHGNVLLFGGQINNLAPTLISYVLLSKADSVTVTGGSGNNTYLVQGPEAATTLNTGSGNDLVSVQDIIAPVTIQGGAGINTLVSRSGVNNWTLTGTNAGTLQNAAFQNFQNLEGGPGSSADNFLFDNGAGVSGTIRELGSGSIATLDYSSYKTPVTVNLKTHTATGVGGGVFQVRNVIGGQGNNILVGDGNNNLLRGGSGRDLLISGGSSSTLQAGGGEAILIGAHLSFDTNPAALDAILAEWAHLYDPFNPLHDYQVRVGHLEHGGGLNGSFLLNPSTVVPQPGATTLSSGAGLDFLILDPSDILTHPLRPGEVELSV